jgi:flagella basal body P-ring formation protein FlgA
MIGIILLSGFFLWGAITGPGPGEGTAWAETSVGSIPMQSDTQAVHAEDFERVVLAELTRRFGRPHHEVSVRILFPREVVEVPRGMLHLEIGDWSGGGRTGRRAFRVEVFVNRKFVKTINVVGEVKAQAEVATPLRWLKPKEVVTAEDLALVVVDVPSLTHDFYLNLEEVVGKQVVRPLPPRLPIKKVMLDYPPVIQKGDRVMIEVRSRGLLVQTIGLAKAAGKTGETIPVQNQSSGREVLGTVVAAGIVEVGF